MSAHQLWHVLVLGSTLLAGASLVVVLLAPLVFGAVPSGLKKMRPVVFGLAAAAAALLALEWLGVHGG